MGLTSHQTKQGTKRTIADSGNVAEELATKKTAQEIEGIEELEEQFLQLKQQQEKGHVDALLAQVRTLAMRPHTDNDLLIATLENLYDVANLLSHPNTETYEVALKACRENSSSGKLHGLIIKLVGTEAAKKAQTAILGWRKAEKRRLRGKRLHLQRSLCNMCPKYHKGALL